MPIGRSVSLLLLATPSAVFAQDEGFCRNGAFPIENNPVGRGVIVGEGRAQFLTDMDGCPSAEARCRQSAYVIAGNRVVTGRSNGSYVCVYYPSRGGGTAGWMDAARVRPVATNPNPPLSEWIGRWSDEGNPRVRFFRRGADLVIEGQAYWPSPNPSPRDFPGGPNEGSIDEPVRVSGNSARAGQCNISFTLLGDLLVAQDPERSCGGLNVSFTGIYRRERR
jgi:hypothetical protein